jgi:hypothetical protein
MAIFLLKDIRAYPYYISLISSFAQCRYEVVVNFNLRFIINSRDYLLLASKRIPIRLTFNRQISDSLDCIILKERTQSEPIKTLYLKKDIYPIRTMLKGEILMPFSVSPYLLSDEFPQTNSNFRRLIKVFFSGNMHKKTYSNEIIHKYFDKLTRIEVLSSIQECKFYKKLDSYQDLKALIDKGIEMKQMIHLNWTYSKYENNDLSARVPESEWMDVLGNCDFFLATPGIRMPMCFNVVESMAKGAIPIIQYPEYFTPPLENNRNCIIFKNKEELKDIIEACIDMDFERIKEIRQGVLNYYNEYLNPENFVKLIEHDSNSEIDLYIQAGEASLIDSKVYEGLR